RVSNDAIAEVRTHIEQTFSPAHLPEKPNTFRQKKDSQDAHEAIRPTSLEYSPSRVRKYLSDEQYKLYKLVWDRFVASQMTQAIYDQTGVDIEAKPNRKGAAHKVLSLRATGKVLKFGGWLDQYQRGVPSSDAQKEFAGEEDAQENGGASNGNGAGASAGNGTTPTKAARPDDDDEGTLPEISEGEVLKLSPPGVATDQKFTQPPPRFNEGSLVRELEKRGIGRPSTYAEIISKVQARAYVEKLPGGA